MNTSASHPLPANGPGLAHRHRQGSWRPWAWLWAAMLAGATLLYWFPPDQYQLYPRCLLYALTGLQCPGCGGLRAAHQLLHGHVAAAFQFNPLLVVLAPLGVGLFLAHMAGVVTGRTWLRPLRHPGWIWLLAGLVLAFAILRNLPLSDWAQAAF